MNEKAIDTNLQPPYYLDREEKLNWLMEAYGNDVIRLATALFHLNDIWYIFVKEGYFPDNIDKEGVLHLTKSSPQKSKGNYGAWAKGYKFDHLKIVYENR